MTIAAWCVEYVEVRIPVTYLIAGGLCLGYLILLIRAVRNPLQLNTVQRSLISTLALALLAQAIQLIPAFTDQRPFAAYIPGGLSASIVAIYLTSLMLVIFASLSARFLQRGGSPILLFLGIVWLVALILFGSGPSSTQIIGTPGWLSHIFTAQPDPASAIAIGGWIAIAAIVLLLSFYSFYKAHLPEIANRALYWVIIVPLLVMGAVLGVSGIDALKEIGWIAQFAAMIGVVYGTAAHRVFDVRRVLRLAIASILVTGRTALVILATRDDNDTIRVEPMAKGLGEIPEIRGWIPKGSPIYQTLFDQRATLLQFDLEYGRQYGDVALELKSFFKQLRMSAYAPIVVQGQLIGVLAAGAKNNDNPFYPQDLELLATLANQTGVALRNARLVNDLRTAGEDMQNLNKDLVGTKERIEQLDSVKTDFITIASHELRTPLAQIRGYTDIIDALNDQGMLDPDQMTGMTTNLRKATDRLERLIGDMLDVSQIGLDAMDLRFAQTTTENVVRLAIEPLTESIKQRKLTVVARGLRDLPPIEADMQRLVQAFRNVVTNAIKYTPDGGRIDITGHLPKNEQTNKDEIVRGIQDTGLCIDPQDYELIFEKFFRVSDPGLHSTGVSKFMGPGPGLGLTIARGVIQGHGGGLRG